MDFSENKTKWQNQGRFQKTRRSKGSLLFCTFVTQEEWLILWVVIVLPLARLASREYVWKSIVVTERFYKFWCTVSSSASSEWIISIRWSWWSSGINALYTYSSPTRGSHFTTNDDRGLTLSQRLFITNPTGSGSAFVNPETLRHTFLLLFHWKEVDYSNSGWYG